jgi:hypothetical protein
MQTPTIYETDATGAFVLFMIPVVVYFLPLIVAINRGHEDRTRIGVLNLLLGWTVIGWIAALVWATTGRKESMLLQAGGDQALSSR